MREFVLDYNLPPPDVSLFEDKFEKVEPYTRSKYRKARDMRGQAKQRKRKRRK